LTRFNSSRLTPVLSLSKRLAPRHSLLLAWVLLVPQSGAPHNVSFADKLRTWVEAGEADTQAECEERREQLKVASAMGRAAEAVERFNQGICVERAKVEAGRK
jgi:hypothetical protein